MALGRLLFLQLRLRNRIKVGLRARHAPLIQLKLSVFFLSNCFFKSMMIKLRLRKNPTLTRKPRNANQDKLKEPMKPVSPYIERSTDIRRRLQCNLQYYNHEYPSCNLRTQPIRHVIVPPHPLTEITLIIIMKPNRTKNKQQNRCEEITNGMQIRFHESRRCDSGDVPQDVDAKLSSKASAGTISKTPIRR
jgi:hypothetical protein